MAQLWRHFTAQADAEIYCDQQTALMSLPPGGVTQRWAEPMRLTDGSYVVPAYQDNTAVPWDSGWVLAPPPPA